MSEEKKPKRMSIADAELIALAKVITLLKELPDDARARVVDFIVGRENQRQKAEG